jgi:hypothetical protein
MGYIRDEPSGMKKYAKTALDDSTGVIDLRAWGEVTKLILKLRQGMHVRVIGKVKAKLSGTLGILWSIAGFSD